MKHTKKIVFSFLSLIISGEVFSSDILAVDEMYEISKSNVQMLAGKTFDEEIQKITMSNEWFVPNLKSCMLNTTPSDIYGVYEFLNKNKAYKVYLKPRSDFSDCVSKLLEGINLPTPPSYPYYSPFELNVKQ